MLSTIDIDEFTRMVGLNLTDGQTSDLKEMLHRHPESGRWRWPTWTVRNRQWEDLVVARVLIGLLLLDENVLWTAPLRLPLRDAFRRAALAISHLGTPTDTPNHFDLGGLIVKIRHANGEERIERLDTGKRVQFACTRYVGSGRGYVADLLILDDTGRRNDLLPTVASRPNPQIIYS